MKKIKKKKRRKMNEQELVQKYQSQYEKDKKAYQACVVALGPRPSLRGTESADQRKGVIEAQESWDYFFENDTFSVAN